MLVLSMAETYSAASAVVKAGCSGSSGSSSSRAEAGSAASSADCSAVSGSAGAAAVWAEGASAAPEAALSAGVVWMMSFYHNEPKANLKIHMRVSAVYAILNS